MFNILKNVAQNVKNAITVPYMNIKKYRTNLARCHD